MELERLINKRHVKIEHLKQQNVNEISHEINDKMKENLRGMIHKE